MNGRMKTRVKDHIWRPYHGMALVWLGMAFALPVLMWRRIMRLGRGRHATP
jgi:hypothetical protein